MLILNSSQNLLVRPKFLSEKPPSLSSQENSSVTQKAHVNLVNQVNLEVNSSHESEINLLLKGNHRTNELASN